MAKIRGAGVKFTVLLITSSRYDILPISPYTAYSCSRDYSPRVSRDYETSTIAPLCYGLWRPKRMASRWICGFLSCIPTPPHLQEQRKNLMQLIFSPTRACFCVSFAARDPLIFHATNPNYLAQFSEENLTYSLGHQWRNGIYPPACTEGLRLRASHHRLTACLERQSRHRNSATVPSPERSTLLALHNARSHPA